MNFDLTEEQQVVRDLAAQLFGDLATTERVKAAEGGDGIDRDLWGALAGAGLLAVCLPEAVGGSEMGCVELCLVLEQQGRHVAPIPLAPTIATAMTLADHLGGLDDVRAMLAGVASGSVVLTAALAEVGDNDPLRPSTLAARSGDLVHIEGERVAVPSLPVADAVVVPVVLDEQPALALVRLDRPGVDVEVLSTTNHESQGRLALDVDIPSELLVTAPEALAQLYHRSLVSNCAIQLGVGAGAIDHVAAHVSTREQFGRPLAAFQAVSQRAADGYILNEALRATVLNAAWQIDSGSATARADVLAAAYWASEGTQRIVLTAQHLHGGIGADVDFPVHRHFLWGMQMATTLGTASSHLARLGRYVAEHGAATS